MSLVLDWCLEVFLTGFHQVLWCKNILVVPTAFVEKQELIQCPGYLGKLPFSKNTFCGRKYKYSKLFQSLAAATNHIFTYSCKQPWTLQSSANSLKWLRFSSGLHCLGHNIHAVTLVFASTGQLTGLLPTAWLFLELILHSPSEVKVELLIKNSCRAVARKQLQKSQVPYA